MIVLNEWQTGSFEWEKNWWTSSFSSTHRSPWGHALKKLLPRFHVILTDLMLLWLKQRIPPRSSIPLTFSSIQPICFFDEGIRPLSPPVSIWCDGKHQPNGRRSPSWCDAEARSLLFCVSCTIVRRKVSKGSEWILSFLWKRRIGAVFHSNLNTAFLLRYKWAIGNCFYGIKFPVKILLRVCLVFSHCQPYQKFGMPMMFSCCLVCHQYFG
jgi:hypothetical protein